MSHSDRLRVDLDLSLGVYGLVFIGLFCGQESKRKKEGIAFHVAGFAIVVIPMDVVLVHAGLAASGAAADTDCFVLLLTLVLMHGIGLYFVQTEIQESVKE